MRLVFSPTYSWPMIAAIAAILLGIIVWSYRARLRQVSPFWAKILLGLRIASCVVLILALLRPSLEFTKKEDDNAVLYVVADASRSMSTRDGPASQTRREALLETLSRNQDLIDELDGKLQIRRFDFADELAAVEELGPEVEGRQTAIGTMLEELLQEAGDARLAGVVLLSDGAQRAFAPKNIDPRGVALRFGEQRIPIQTVPFGGTGFSETALDLAIEEMLVDPIAFENTTVPVSLRLRAVGAAGKKIRVRLLVENRLSVAPGGTGELQPPLVTGDARPVQEITVEGNNQVIPVELSYIPASSGEFKLRVEVEPLDDEVKTVNNSRETIITVQAGGIRVAFLHSLPAEQKFIRRVGQTEQIQIDSQLVFLGNLSSRSSISDKWFEKDRYDVYLIGDIPANRFSDEQLQQLSERVLDEGAGLMMLGGIRSFGPGGYAGTPLDDVLPVLMRRSEIQNDGGISEDLHLLKDMRIVPTSQGSRHYLMRLDNNPDPTAKWKKLPPIQGGNRLAAKNQIVQILAESEQGDPLLFAQEVGKARVLAFAGDSTWLWPLHGFQQEHLRFWQQIILWLSRKELDQDSQVWVRVDQRNFGQGQRVPLTFGARDEKGEPLADADFAIEVIGPDETKHTPAIQGVGGERGAELIETRLPGDYWVKVSATQSGQVLGQPAWTRFLVDAGDLELDNPSADYGLLEEISKLSGGALIPPENLEKYLKSLRDGGIPRFELEEIRRMSLWDNWLYLLILTALLTLEWFFRKRKGLV